MLRLVASVRRVVKSSAKRVWPYILPFPLNTEKRNLLWSILQSRVGLGILEAVEADKKVYQHELMEKLAFSNKSIIKYLGKMVRAEILEQGMEARAERTRAVWIKWFKPTSLGRWLILFLKPPEKVSRSVNQALILELFGLYSSSVVEVSKKYGLDVGSFHRNLDKHYLQESIREERKGKPEVIAFGSVALDIYGRLKALPASGQVAYVMEVGRYAGGMGANVAIALSKLQVPVAFVGKVGVDSSGRKLLEALKESNVDVSGVHLAEGSSLQTLVLQSDGKHRWLLAVGAENSAISVSSPKEVDWDIVRDCRIVYVGEVFLEVASTIADYARTNRKIVIYRPGSPYMEHGVEKIRRVLEHTTTFILSHVAWKKLQETSTEELETPNELLKIGPRNVVLTMGERGCRLFSRGQAPRQFPVPPELKQQYKVVDPTGAGDGFSAGFMWGLLRNMDLENAVLYAQTVASITCSRVSASKAFPTEEEVEAAMNLLGF